MQTSTLNQILSQLLNWVSYPENKQYYQDILLPQLKSLEEPKTGHNFYLYNPDDILIEPTNITIQEYNTPEVQDLNRLDITLNNTILHFIEY